MIGEEVVVKPVQVIPVSNLSMVKQLCNIVDGIIGIAGSTSASAGEHTGDADADGSGMLVYGI